MLLIFISLLLINRIHILYTGHCPFYYYILEDEEEDQIFVWQFKQWFLYYSTTTTTTTYYAIFCCNKILLERIISLNRFLLLDVAVARENCCGFLAGFECYKNNLRRLVGKKSYNAAMQYQVGSSWTIKKFIFAKISETRKTSLLHQDVNI